MKNKEKFTKEIVELACDGNRIAIVRKTGEFRSCYETPCRECLFHSSNTEQCKEKTREWAEAEYVEKPVSVISKRDREFLEYIDSGYKHVTRDANGRLEVWCDKPSKGLAMWLSCDVDLVNDNSFGIFGFTIDFPMVKFEDEEPWLIEDLKKLEVVDSYE